MVNETHREGVKLSRDEIFATPPTLGQLTVEDWREGNAENRVLRVAHLKHPTIEYHRSPLNPLFEPVIVRMTSKGFLLVGWQINTTLDGDRREYKQGWSVVPAGR